MALGFSSMLSVTVIQLILVVSIKADEARGGNIRALRMGVLTAGLWALAFGAAALRGRAWHSSPHFSFTLSRFVRGFCHCNCH